MNHEGNDPTPFTPPNPHDPPQTDTEHRIRKLKGVVIALAVLCIAEGVVIVHDRWEQDRGETVRHARDFSMGPFEFRIERHKDFKDKLDAFDSFFDDEFFEDLQGGFGASMEELERYQERFERFADQERGKGRGRHRSRSRRDRGEEETSSFIDIDRRDEEDAVILDIEIPNLRENTAEVEIEDDRIVVSGEVRKERERADRGRRKRHTEIRRFSEAITLPRGVDPTKAEIEVDEEDERITVRLPKNRT